MTTPGPWFACLLLSLAACSTSGANGPREAPSVPSGETRATVARAAAAALSWELAGPHVLWSPFDCRMAPPPAARMSRARTADGASDVDGHGSKLYVLRSNDVSAYMNYVAAPGEHELPVGLALVKQAYAPVALDASAAPEYGGMQSHSHVNEAGFFPFAERQGQSFRTGEPRGSFVMLRVAAGTPDSERGWIYGTVTPAGEVTAAGRVESCLACHRKAGPESLFGVEYK